MVGNQVIINSQVLEHPKNPIKESIGDKEPMDIVYVITDEFWKHWRKRLTNSQSPHLYAPGLGTFDLIYGKSRTYLRKMLRIIRNIKRKHPETHLIEGTRANGRYQNAIKNFRIVWKQVDEKKKEVNRNLEVWRDKKIEKYGDKAIL